MFNLQFEVQKLRQRAYAKIHGLPIIRHPKDAQVSHVDGIQYDIKAEQEDTYIQRRFRNRTVDFGRRLSKRKGQYHRPGSSNSGIRDIPSLYKEI